MVVVVLTSCHLVNVNLYHVTSLFICCAGNPDSRGTHGELYLIDNGVCSFKE